jgi:hypothetical protein
VAVNFALRISKYLKKNINIVDMDIVNPYFRSREAREILAEHGIRSIIPENQYLYADLPIIMPEIKGAIENEAEYTILDVGGDDAGARILSSFHHSFNISKSRILMVVNKNRPFTNSVNGCLKIIDEIEVASKLRITGLVSNTHLIEESNEDVVYEGYEFARELAESKKIEVEFVCVLSDLFSGIDRKRIPVPLLKIQRMMLKPWENKRQKLGHDRFRL